MTSERWGARAATLLMLGMLGCGGATVETGIQAELALMHGPDGEMTSSDGRKAFVTQGGQSIALSRAWVTVYGMELLPCSHASAKARPAHGESSPTRLGSPVVEDMLSPDGQAGVVGILEPPPGQWCTLRVTLEPADADADGLPDTVDLIGQTAWVEGEVDERDGQGPQPFTLTSAGVRWVDLPMGGDAGVELSENAPALMLDVRFAYDRFFDSDSLIDAVAASMTLNVSRPDTD